MKRKASSPAGYRSEGWLKGIAGERVTDTLPNSYTRMFLHPIPLVAPLLTDSRLTVLPLPVRN